MDLKSTSPRSGRARHSVQAMHQAIDDLFGPLAAETVSVREAAGRILAEALVSPRPVPSFARAAMDGYALRAADTDEAPTSPRELLVIGSALAGQRFEGVVERGQAVRIMTGAPMPAGANAVLMQEQATAFEKGGQQWMRPQASLLPRKNVVAVGEDIAGGETILPLGRTLRPQDVAMAATLNTPVLSVVRRPRVSLLVTGNELVPVGESLPPDHIVETNSLLLRSLLARDGAMLAGDGQSLLVGDDPRELEERLDQLDGDVILVTGGTAHSEEDHLSRLMREQGEIRVHGLALKPAGPTGLGRWKGRPIFLMPGQPVSCLVAYDLFVRRAIQRMGGRRDAFPYPSRVGNLAEPVHSVAGRTDYLRVTIDSGGSVRLAKPTGGANLSSTVRGDGFVVVPESEAVLLAGQMVDVYLYD